MSATFWEQRKARQEERRKSNWAKWKAAHGEHHIFQESKRKRWVCVCGEFVGEDKPDAEFHVKYPHMTTYPEDWAPLD